MLIFCLLKDKKNICWFCVAPSYAETFRRASQIYGR